MRDRVLLALLASVLVASVWRAGIDYDEQIQFQAVLGAPILERATAPFNLFDFSHVGADVASDLQRGRDLVYRGALKWCQDPFPLRVRFFRPLASALMSAEIWTFGFHFRLYHLVQLALSVAAVAMFVALWNLALTAAGVSAVSPAIAIGVLVLNPLNQEMLERICTSHYALAAILGFGAYLALVSPRLRPAARGPIVLALAALSLLASEAAIPVHVLGAAALSLQWRQLTRSQRALWALVSAGVAGYLAWYELGPFGASGWGYSGSTNASGASILDLLGRGFDGALDVFAGVYLARVTEWRGFLDAVGRGGDISAVALAAAFVGAVAIYASYVREARRVTATLLVAEAAAAVPVAAVGQSKLRVLALAGFAVELLLVLMARDAWHGLRDARRIGDVRRARALAVVLCYASLRLAITMAFTPVAIAKVETLSRITARRWLGSGSKPELLHPPISPEPARVETGNVLLTSGSTGVPYPFGPAILARAGFAPDLDQWLFLSDLSPGTLQIAHLPLGIYRIALTPLAAKYNAEHYALFSMAQRCYAIPDKTFETRFATIQVLASTAQAEPLAVDVKFHSEESLRFWTIRGTELVPVSLPAEGQSGIY
jgi:hypothetical protein